MLNETLGVLVERPGELDLALKNLLVNEHWVIIAERVNSSKHFIEKNSKTPPVHRLSVSLIQKHFGGQIFRSSAQRVGPCLDNLCKTKICEFEVAFLVNKHVFGFKITVYDVLGMQEFKHASDLRNIELSLFDFELAFSS